LKEKFRLGFKVKFEKVVLRQLTQSQDRIRQAKKLFFPKTENKFPKRRRK
jgi:hypothetical protein